MSEGRQNSCSDNRLTGNQTNRCKLDGMTVQVHMQDKISYCPARLVGAQLPTLYTVNPVKP